MGSKKRYRKKADLPVVAVQLNLDTEGFTYNKWGGIQTCKRGDWLVDNGGEFYTIDREVFARTYRQKKDRPGEYDKVTAVWAEVAAAPGKIETKEGVTHYKAGDYIVYNEPDDRDGYAITAEKFKEMYEPAS